MMNDYATPENMEVVRREVRRMLRRVPHHVDRGDIESAAALGLVHAARSYRKSTNVPFHAYAIRRIRGTIIDSLRDWNHTRRQGDKPVFVPVDEVLHIPDATVPYDEMVEYIRQREYLYRKINEITNARHRQMFWLYLQGMSTVKIARQLGVAECLPSVVIRKKLLQWKHEYQQQTATLFARGCSLTSMAS